MEGKVYIAAIIDRGLCALIETPKSDHYQFATLGVLHRLKDEGGSMVSYPTIDEAKAHLDEIATETKGKRWKVFLVPTLAEANPGLALGFRVRSFLDAIDEFNQFEGADEDDPDYKTAKEDLATARRDLEEMDAAVSIHGALNDPALASANI